MECHNTAFGSKRSDICAQAVYFVHSTMPSVMCLRLTDVSFICRATYFQFPIHVCFSSISVRQAAQRGIGLIGLRNIGHRTLPKIWVGTFLVRTMDNCELTFTITICNRRSVCPSVVCLSVTFVLPTHPVEIFGNFLVPWPSIDMHGRSYRDRPRGTPPSGGLNARGVAKNSDFDIWNCCISETVQDRR